MKATPVTMGDVYPQGLVEVDEDENDDEYAQVCELCAAHEKAYDTIPDGIVCGHCQELSAPGAYNVLSGIEYKVVGQTNGYVGTDRMDKYLCFTCKECGNTNALIPAPIIYNGNHDVYYTGGRDYLIDDDVDGIFKIAQKAIEEHLLQWQRRIKAGEDLPANYPALWMRRDITHAIAEYLHSRGLKK